MKDTKKIEDISMITVSAKVIGEIIGVGDRQVRNLADEGILVRNSHGKYLLLKSLKNYVLNLKISKAGENIQSDFNENGLDIDQEKAKNEHFKGMISELKYALFKGTMHRSEDVGRVITDMFVKFRNKMTAIPATLAPRLEGKNKLEIQNILMEHVNQALSELSEYNPADYYSDEYMNVPDDDLVPMIRRDVEDEE